jgi:hypothetical protein
VGTPKTVEEKETSYRKFGAAANPRKMGVDRRWTRSECSVQKEALAESRAWWIGQEIISSQLIGLLPAKAVRNLICAP